MYQSVDIFKFFWSGESGLTIKALIDAFQVLAPVLKPGPVGFGKQHNPDKDKTIMLIIFAQNNFF